MSVIVSKALYWVLVPLIAKERYRGTDGLVAACNAVISEEGQLTMIISCDTADLDGGNI